MKDHLANPTLGTIQAKNHGPMSNGKSYRVSISSSASRFEAELEVPNTVQAINAETVILRVEVLRERLGRTLVLFRDTLGPHAWTERPRGLDGRVTWVKDEGPLWVPRELVSIDENEKFVRELADQLLKLIREPVSTGRAPTRCVTSPMRTTGSTGSWTWRPCSCSQRRRTSHER